MGLRSRLFGAGGQWGSDLVTASRDAMPSPFQALGMPVEGGLLPSGVTSQTVLGISAVWRCLDILANGVAQLDWTELRGNLPLPPSRLVRQPQAQRTRREWTSIVVSTLALYDVCYLLKVGGDGEGVPVSLLYLQPSIVQPAQFDLWGILPPTSYLVKGVELAAENLVVLHRSPQPGVFDGMGGLLKLARSEFASAIAAGNYVSRYWQGGGSPNVVLETDANIDQTIADSWADRWQQRNAYGPDRPRVIGGGLKAKDFGADPTTAAAVEAAREQVAIIARYFGVPTRIVNAPTGDTQTYNTSEAGNQDLVRYTLQNYIDAITDAITSQLPGGRRIQMDTDRLTRGVQYNRAQSWNLALGGKPWMTADEVRDAEGLPPVENPADLLPTPAPAPAPVAVGGSNG
jgi:HK97 family phage portal protein